MKLFYVILGATPEGRNIEQHDVFFGIAEKFSDLVQAMKDFWPEAKGKIHIDCYQEVNFVDGFKVKIVERSAEQTDQHLFFLNLGGYKAGFFEEFHQQHLMVGKNLAEVVKKVKQSDFYLNMGFKNAESHIDDKHGVDIDDVFRVNDILPSEMKNRYAVVLEKSDNAVANFTHIGYLKIDKI